MLKRGSIRIWFHMRLDVVVGKPFGISHGDSACPRRRGGACMGTTLRRGLTKRTASVPEVEARSGWWFAPGPVGLSFYTVS